MRMAESVAETASAVKSAMTVYWEGEEGNGNYIDAGVEEGKRAQHVLNGREPRHVLAITEISPRR